MSQPASHDDDVPVCRYKLTIAYDGTHFHGWQRQKPPVGDPPRTVAGVLDEHLSRILRQPIQLTGSSRTDSGVHARGQVAHMDAAVRIPLDRLPHAINSRLPDDVQVLRVEPAPPGFHAIGDAKRKAYTFRIFTGPIPPLEQRWFVWHCHHRMSVLPMHLAAKRLIGTHDFAGFASIHHGRTTTIRTITDCHVTQCARGRELTIYVEGTGFLYNMVRIIAGTLVEVGRHRREPKVIDEMLATGNRRLGGPTLPGSGLRLEWIEY